MTRTTQELRTIATTASSRAGALRDHASRITADALEPLRRALHVRAGQLELAAAALGQLDATEGDEPLLRATA